MHTAGARKLQTSLPVTVRSRLLASRLCAARCDVTVAATSQPRDFDEFLEMVADKFEKVDNKPVVIG